MLASDPPQTEGRCGLYRLIADAVRLRLLALAAEKELTVGELADLLDESQPNVSRHVGALRQGKLLRDRRDGTRIFVRIADAALKDVVVGDALAEGRRLCLEEGRLERLALILARRHGRAVASLGSIQTERASALAPELPVYVKALSLVSVERQLALDTNAGEGGMLDVLAPMFRRVIAAVRTSVELERASRKVHERGYTNVELLLGDIDDRELRRRVGEGANAVFASRLLHHAERPRVTLAALTTLTLPGGQLVLIDYEAHQDESFRRRHADYWPGFGMQTLSELMQASGLATPECLQVPRSWLGEVDEAQFPWLIARATRPMHSRP